jgi:hypothetical protein
MRPTERVVRTAMADPAMRLTERAVRTAGTARVGFGPLELPAG